MRDWLKGVIKNKRNFTCVYLESKHGIYSVPRTPSNVAHFVLTFVMTIAFFAVAGFIKWLTTQGLIAVLPEGQYPWWATFIDSFVGAVLLVYFFVVLGARFGMYPFMTGFSIQLDKKSKTDEQLAKLIKKNPRTFNIDWIPEWAEATVSHREKMLGEMKSKVTSSSKKSAKKAAPVTAE